MFESIMAFFEPYGTVPGSSLNWSQHAALQKAGRHGNAQLAASATPGIDSARICAVLEDVGERVDDVVDAVESLVSELGLRLDEQTEQLERQADLLTEIANTLRNPARTRSAERVRDATELLAHHRNQRALTVAQQAIDDNPNNEAAFIAAGWSCLGLQRPGDARDFFREAAEATASTKGMEERHVNAVRLAGRLTFVLEGARAAIDELAGVAPFYDKEAAKALPKQARIRQL